MNRLSFVVLVLAGLGATGPSSAQAQSVDFSYRVAPVQDGSRFVYLSFDPLSSRFAIYAVKSKRINEALMTDAPPLELLVVSPDRGRIQPLYTSHFSYRYSRSKSDDILDSPDSRTVTSFSCTGTDFAKSVDGVHDTKRGLVTTPVEADSLRLTRVSVS